MLHSRPRRRCGAALLLAALLAPTSARHLRLPAAAAAASAPAAAPAALAASPLAPPPFPLFLQCDARWANDEMGVQGNGERSTICGEGCAMSCLAMVLSGIGVRVFGTLPATPQTLNAWLLVNAGYTCIDGDCNDLVLDAVQRLDPRVRLVGYLDVVPPFADLAAGVQRGALAYIARIVPDDPRFESHFILLTGVSPSAPSTNFTVLDPYYPKTQYAYTDFKDLLVYNISAAE
jgi:hypothetical protein